MTNPYAQNTGPQGGGYGGQPNTGPQNGGYGGQMPPAGPVPPAPGAPGQPRTPAGPAPLPPPTSNTPLIVGLVVGALVVVLVIVGVLWFTRWRVPRTPAPAYNPGPVSTTRSPRPTATNRAPASSFIETQVTEECHNAVKQTIRNPLFTRDSATYGYTDSSGDQHWTVSGRATGTNTAGKIGTFQWTCTATYFDKTGLVDAWSSVDTTPVR